MATSLSAELLVDEVAAKAAVLHRDSGPALLLGAVLVCADASGSVSSGRPLPGNIATVRDAIVSALDLLLDDGGRGAELRSRITAAVEVAFRLRLGALAQHFRHHGLSIAEATTPALLSLGACYCRFVDSRDGLAYLQFLQSGTLAAAAQAATRADPADPLSDLSVPAAAVVLGGAAAVVACFDHVRGTLLKITHREALVRCLGDSLMELRTPAPASVLLDARGAASWHALISDAWLDAQRSTAASPPQPVAPARSGGRRRSRERPSPAPAAQTSSSLATPTSGSANESLSRAGFSTSSTFDEPSRAQSMARVENGAMSSPRGPGDNGRGERAPRRPPPTVSASVMANIRRAREEVQSRGSLFAPGHRRQSSVVQQPQSEEHGGPVDSGHARRLESIWELRDKASSPSPLGGSTPLVPAAPGSGVLASPPPASVPSPMPVAASFECPSASVGRGPNGGRSAPSSGVTAQIRAVRARFARATTPRHGQGGSHIPEVQALISRTSLLSGGPAPAPTLQCASNNEPVYHLGGAPGAAVAHELNATLGTAGVVGGGDDRGAVEDGGAFDSGVTISRPITMLSSVKLDSLRGEYLRDLFIQQRELDGWVAKNEAVAREVEGVRRSCEDGAREVDELRIARDALAAELTALESQL